MISLIVMAYEDPKSTKKAIKRILDQGIKSEYEIIVTCPDNPTRDVVLEYMKLHPGIFRFIRQPYGCGKNKMVNLILKEARGDIIVFMDGNKFLEDNALIKIIRPFENPEVGCVGGRPVALNNKNNLLGYWAHLLVDSAHRIRDRRSKEKKFVEQTANLLAVRNGIIKNIPNDVAEDSIIPYLIIKEGYKNIYVGDAKVSVTYPRIFKEWMKQKIRCIKAHEALNRYIVNKSTKQKSFLNEFFYGSYMALSYANSPKEFIWSLLLFPARFYVWLKAFYDIKIRKNVYTPDWSRSNSTKPLDWKENRA